MSIIFDVLRSWKKKETVVNTIPAEPLPPLPEIKFRNYDEYLEQRSSSCDFDQESLKVIKQRGYKMKIKKGTRKIVLLQYLLSKFLWDDDGIHLDEHLALVELYDIICEEKRNDTKFQEKYGQSLQACKYMILTLSGVRYYPIQHNDSLDSKRMIAKSLGNIILKPEAYFGMRGNRNVKDSYKIQINFSLSTPTLKPKRFIGVGYKDKGSRRDPAYDGTPSWQSVAQEYSEMESAFVNLLLYDPDAEIELDGRPRESEG